MRRSMGASRPSDMRMRLPRWVSEMASPFSGSKKAVSPSEVKGFQPLPMKKSLIWGPHSLRGCLHDRLLNDQSVAIRGWHNAEETDLIGEECVVKQPSLQIVNGRGL